MQSLRYIAIIKWVNWVYDSPQPCMRNIHSGVNGTLLSIERVGCINQTGYTFAVGLQAWQNRFRAGL